MDMFKIAKLESLIGQISVTGWLPFEEFPEYSLGLQRQIKAIAGRSVIAVLKYNLPDIAPVQTEIFKVPMKITDVKIIDDQLINEISLTGILTAGNVIPRFKGKVSVLFKDKKISLILYKVREKNNHSPIFYKTIMKSKLGFEMQLYYMGKE